jgi:hypothetical protein
VRRFFRTGLEGYIPGLAKPALNQKEERQIANPTHFWRTYHFSQSPLSPAYGSSTERTLKVAL